MITCSTPSKTHSAGGVLIYLFNKIDFTASKRGLLSMLRNMSTISKLYKIVFVGIVGINIINYIKQMATILNSRWYNL